VVSEPELEPEEEGWIVARPMPSHPHRRKPRVKAADLPQNRLQRKADETKKRITEIESQLAENEKQLAELEKMFTSQEFYSDNTQVKESVEKHRLLREETDILTQEWEESNAEMERIGKELGELGH
jgi:uncharacterized coiled-coil protein SlyX